MHRKKGDRRKGPYLAEYRPIWAFATMGLAWAVETFPLTQLMCRKKGIGERVPIEPTADRYGRMSIWIQCGSNDRSNLVVNYRDVVV